MRSSFRDMLPASQPRMHLSHSEPIASAMKRRENCERSVFTSTFSSFMIILYLQRMLLRELPRRPFLRGCSLRGHSFEARQKEEEEEQEEEKKKKVPKVVSGTHVVTVMWN